MLEWTLIFLSTVTLTAAHAGDLGRGFKALQHVKHVKERLAPSLKERYPNTSVGIGGNPRELLLALTVHDPAEYAALVKEFPAGTRIDDVLIEITPSGTVRAQAPTAGTTVTLKLVERPAPRPVETLETWDFADDKEVLVRKTSRFVRLLRSRGYPVTSQSGTMHQGRPALTVGIGHEAALAALLEAYPSGTEFEGLPVFLHFVSGGGAAGVHPGKDCAGGLDDAASPRPRGPTPRARA